MLQTKSYSGIGRCKSSNSMVRASVSLRRMSVLFSSPTKHWLLRQTPGTIVQCQRNRFRQTVCCVPVSQSVMVSVGIRSSAHRADTRRPRSQNKRLLLSKCRANTTFVASIAMRHVSGNIQQVRISMSFRSGVPDSRNSRLSDSQHTQFRRPENMVT